MTTRMLTPEQRARLRRLRALARFLDESVLVPGTGYRFGMDAIIGLVPVLGDVLTTTLAVYIVREAARLGVPRGLVLRMVLNVSIDLVGGLVPVAGDAFDLVWKANKKNIALLEAHLRAQGFADDEPYLDV